MKKIALWSAVFLQVLVLLLACYMSFRELGLLKNEVAYLSKIGAAFVR